MEDFAPHIMYPPAIEPVGERRPRAATMQRAALDVCATVIAGPPPLVADLPEKGTLITTRWLHPVLHDHIPALPIHVVGTYYGAPAPRVWRVGGIRFEGIGRAGGIGIVPANWDGHWDIEAEASLSYAMLSDNRLQQIAGQWLDCGRKVELIPCVGETDPVGAGIMRALNRQAAIPDPSTNLYVEQALDLLCLHLLRVHSTLAKPATPLPRRGLLPWQVRRVTAYMRERLDREIGLDELASEVRLSRFHFCTAFRLATGQTPFEWLTGMRIDHARALLADPWISVTDVAFAVGYKTPSAFSASFRKVAGVTPSEYRRRL